MTADEIKQGVLDTFFKMADRFGVPCVVLAVVLYFGREAAIALHGTVVEPMVQSHMEYLESTASTLKEIGETQKQQAETLDELYRGQTDLHKVVKDVLISGSRPMEN